MLFDPGPALKKCFVYCGDDRCNCEAAPRYRDLMVPPVCETETGNQTEEQTDGGDACQKSG